VDLRRSLHIYLSFVHLDVGKKYSNKMCATCAKMTKNAQNHEYKERKLTPDAALAKKEARVQPDSHSPYKHLSREELEMRLRNATKARTRASLREAYWRTKAVDVTDSTTNADFRNMIIAYPVLRYCVLMSLVSLALLRCDVRAR
jgi:hypothetical protein